MCHSVWHDEMSLRPIQHMNLPFVQRIHAVYATCLLGTYSHLSYEIHCHGIAHDHICIIFITEYRLNCSVLLFIFVVSLLSNLTLS